MSTQYLTTPPAHMPLFIWGDAGAASGKYTLRTNRTFYDTVNVYVTKHFTDVYNHYVSLSDRGNARFSKSAAEACAKFVRDRIRQNAYASMVPALSKKWAATKNRLKLAHQVGMATEQMVENISAFRTNIKDATFSETRHTGYVVGINQKADFSKEDSTVNRILSKKAEKRSTKLRKGYQTQVKGKSVYRLGSDFLNAKLYWLEHGKKVKGHKGAVSKQPPRPIFTKAVEDFIKTKFDAEDFIGQLKIGSSGKLEFKFKAHR